jgi:hypothetical protein
VEDVFEERVSYVRISARASGGLALNELGGGGVRADGDGEVGVGGGEGQC